MTAYHSFRTTTGPTTAPAVPANDRVVASTNGPGWVGPTIAAFVALAATVGSSRFDRTTTRRRSTPAHSHSSALRSRPSSTPESRQCSTPLRFRRRSIRRGSNSPM